MTFDYPGYPLKFIQKDACRDSSKHLFTFIYKFFSPVTRYQYVLRADCHEGEVFAVKFYCKKDKRSDFKYSKITNRGDLGNILITCLSVIPVILRDFPKASFAFSGASTVDLKSKKREKTSPTQRYKVYKYIASSIIGTETFAHFSYDKASSYMLVNKLNKDILKKERQLIAMFIETYLILDEIV